MRTSFKKGADPLRGLEVGTSSAGSVSNSKHVLKATSETLVGSTLWAALLMSAWSAATVLHAQAPARPFPDTPLPAAIISSGGTVARSAPESPWTADGNRVSGSLRPNNTPVYPNLPVAGSPVVTTAAQEPAVHLPQLTSTQAADGAVAAADNRSQPATAQVHGSAKHIPLTPPSDRFKGGAPQPASGTLQTLVSVGSSLLLVIGLFLGVAWCYRKTLSSTGGGGLPKQVVNVLGRTSISARQQMVLVRFGSKLLLVSVVQGEARTIGEISDPMEVDQLVGLCESGQPNSITNSFKSVLLQEGGR